MRNAFIGFFPKKILFSEFFPEKDYGIIGDGGFTFNKKGTKKKKQIKGLKPFRRNSKYNEERKEFNRALSEIRVVIENVNRKLKDWRVLATKYRHSLEEDSFIKFNEVFRVCVLLTQKKILEKPLRKSNWKPKSFDKIKEIPK